MAEAVRVESPAELSRLVAERIMGWPHVAGDDPLRDFASDGYIYEGIIYRMASTKGFDPATEAGDAWEVVERMRAAKYTFQLSDGGGVYGMHFLDSARVVGWAHHENVATAICLAALRAKGIEVEMALTEEAP